jgi:HAD superfamily hydrolase (TIGR01509 family)
MGIPILFYFRKMTSKAIIFDLGGVLIDLNYQLTISAFENLGITDFKSLYSQANQSGLFDAYETGKISTQRFINEVLNFMPSKCNPNLIVKAWNAMILDFKKDKHDLLVSLKKEHRLFLLSNTNALHVDKVFSEWSKLSKAPMESFFDKVYFSHQIGMRKPDSEIFLHVCNENNLNPNDTLFIDDSAQHIKGAEKVGLKTLLHPQNQSLDASIILAQFD